MSIFTRIKIRITELYDRAITAYRDTHGEVGYNYNKVRYIITSEFMPQSENEKQILLDDRLKEYLQSPITDLTSFTDGGIITDRNIPTAGKED